MLTRGKNLIFTALLALTGCGAATSGPSFHPREHEPDAGPAAAIDDMDGEMCLEPEPEEEPEPCEEE